MAKATNQGGKARALSAKAIVSRCKKAGIESPKTAVVCGSGLYGLADVLSPKISFEYKDVANLPVPRVPGHPGILHLGYCGDVPTAVFAGRVHRYEGVTYEQAMSFVRLAHDLGCDNIILTGSVGGIAGDLKPGDVVLVEDHIYLQPGNPLFEASINRTKLDPFKEKNPERSPFVNLSAVYDRSFFEELSDAAAETGARAVAGVLAVLLGPHYETPAEIRMLRTMGAHAAGMSTGAEAIFAKYLGMNVCAFGLVTNRAHDTLPPRRYPVPDTSHEEVLEAAAAGTKTMINVAVEAIRQLGKKSS